MVEQVLPHAGRFVNHGDAELRQLFPRPDAGKHQKVRRFERPGAQDNIVRLQGENFPAAFRFHAGHRSSVKDDPPHERARP